MSNTTVKKLLSATCGLYIALWAAAYIKEFTGLLATILTVLTLVLSGAFLITYFIENLAQGFKEMGVKRAKKKL